MSSGELESEESSGSSEEYFPQNGNFPHRNPSYKQEDGKFTLSIHNKASIDRGEVLSYQPFFWNGLRWKASTNTFTDTRISEKLTHQDITVISWNVWFGTRNRSQRMKALGKVITQHSPDFIFFQEINSELMQEISSSNWVKSYYVSDPHANRVDRYGNCMFSRYKFRECIQKDLESKMGRKLLTGSCIVQKSPQLTFGTFHLESDPPNVPERAKQVEEYMNTTKNCPVTFLVGDTNFVNEGEDALFKTRFKDVWETLNPTDSGFTFDTQANIMARNEYLSRGITDHKRKRLDRLYFTPATIDPISIQLLGTKPYRDNEFISDHFGLLVKLRIKTQ